VKEIITKVTHINLINYIWNAFKELLPANATNTGWGHIMNKAFIMKLKVNSLEVVKYPANAVDISFPTGDGDDGTNTYHMNFVLYASSKIK